MKTMPVRIDLDEDWRDRAACQDMDQIIFFPPIGVSSRPAKLICAVCPVSAECLDFALRTHERHGVWGGSTERDRRKLRRLHHPA